LFFVVTFLVRFALAKDDRRAILRALLVAMVPPYVVLGIWLLLGTLGVIHMSALNFVAPALALTPLSASIAFVRHDLWGSRARLSRAIRRIVIAGFTCALAVGVGASLAAALGVPFRGALLAAAASGVVAALLVGLALGAGDRRFFPSRAAYKPTIEQLSEDLT